jgi:26S proteasome regulatory subunit N3
LDSIEETELIVAKAIRDGVIEAVINHEEGFMQSKEVVDVYTSNDP